MCTRISPDLVPDCQLFPEEVDEPEEGLVEEGKEREADSDSAVESFQGSDASEVLTRLVDKEEAPGDLFFSGDK